MPRTHQLIDQRSLELHQLVAEKIRAQPELMDEAKRIVDRWLSSSTPNSRPYLLRWRKLVHGDIEACLQFSIDPSDDATAMRQSSPLSCLLSNSDRFKFFSRWKSKFEA